jgi:hypothetical protein
MRKLAALTISLFMVAAPVIADTPKDADAQPVAAEAAKAAKPKAAAAKAAKKAENRAASFAAELEELRQTLQSQQEQLQLLKEELAKRDRQIDEAREAATAANARAAEANAKAVEAVSSTASVRTTTDSLNTTVTALKTSSDSLATTVANQQAAARAAEETGPASIKYKGITITPGGFLAAETVTRSRTASADINTPFTGIPYPGNALSKVAENNFTARQSRIILLGETKIGSAKATGYYEADFLGAGVTSNNRQSNSYVLRQRQLWGQVALDAGWTFTGGQMWSLATETRKGIQNRQEALPLVIDPQYNVGFTWARQYGFRVVRDFGGKVAVALSVEGPQATVGGRGFSTFTSATGTVSQNFFIGAPGAGGGLFNFVDTTGYSINKSPDIVAKAAFDPGIGHYEVFGIVSVFRNRIYPCAVVTPTPSATVIVNGPPLTCGAGVTAPSSAGAFNDTKTGGGLAASARWSVVNKKVDFGVKGVAGDGIGRYGSAQLADMTFRPNGTTALVRTAHGLGIFELHPNPKLDVYFYYGAEYAWRAAYQGYQIASATTAGGVTTVTSANNRIGGYGSPFASNQGCSTENPPSGSFTPSSGGTCNGDIRIIQEGTVGFWHKFYQGPKGGLRWGLQYSYITKSGWSGNNLPTGIGTGVGVAPKAVDNMFWTSFRYYIP